jgi:hypothetical protein
VGDDNCKKCKWFEGCSVANRKEHNGQHFYDTGHCFKLEGHFPFDLQEALPKICKFYEVDEWI